jgi:hypothetical protein
MGNRPVLRPAPWRTECVRSGSTAVSAAFCRVVFLLGTTAWEPGAAA